MINFTIADTVTNIGDGASLLRIRDQHGHRGTYVAGSIGDWAFAFCPSLTNVNFRGNPPGLGTANVFNNDTLLPGSAVVRRSVGLGAVLWSRGPIQLHDQ